MKKDRRIQLTVISLDPLVTPEMFATATCEDFQLPMSMHSLITKQIQEQLTEHKASDVQRHVNANSVHDVDETSEAIECGANDDKEDAWWEQWRARLHGSEDQVKIEEMDDLVPLDVASLPRDQPDVKGGPLELRILVKVIVNPEFSHND